MKTLVQQLADAPRDKVGKPKFPLDCGCTGEKYYALCADHQGEVQRDSARLMGIPDLRFTHRDFTNLTQLAQTLTAIKLQLISNPTKSCLIKIIPENDSEANASRSD